jgi:hypothetical protein
LRDDQKIYFCTSLKTYGKQLILSLNSRDVIQNEDFRTYREGLLKALDHPGLPLHNNDSERDIQGIDFKSAFHLKFKHLFNKKNMRILWR